MRLMQQGEEDVEVGRVTSQGAAFKRLRRAVNRDSGHGKKG